ncbi:MAG: 50S ribosomal protein L3 [Proteobacteria bacterium]|nr:50S ribosomal protein L3 [Pseudomonadota bacterium]
MVNGILGKKVGMTHIYTDNIQVPVTVIEAGPNHVVQKKSVATDAYDAVQIGFLEKKASRLNKASTGHYKKNNAAPGYHLSEVGAEDFEALTPGQVINCADVFKEGDFVDVTGTSKGRGFAGVIKRWNFHCGPKGHGSRHQRAPGSIGQGSDPSRVYKGKKMPGQLGNKKISTQNLKVMDVLTEENVILIKGCVPGAIGSIVLIKKALKKG